MAPLHVVFGTGQIGSALARRLAGEGLRVRGISRSGKELGPAIESLGGDARDPGFASRAANGAEVLYHCMNPTEYAGRAWEHQLPEMTEALIAAAVAQGARLVVLDNLYAYGKVDGRRTESTPLRGRGRKARARKVFAERIEDAGRTMHLRYVIARAGDFFGPGAKQAVVSEEVIRGMMQGKTVWLPGDPDAPHAFGYVPDVVEGLRALGTADADVEEQVFHLPVVETTTRTLVEGLAIRLGVKSRIRSGGRLLFPALAPFVPLFRELLETLYQWDRPFLVDDGKFRARFPGIGTRLQDALDALAQHLRSSEAARASEGAARNVPRKPAEPLTVRQ